MISSLFVRDVGSIVRDTQRTYFRNGYGFEEINDVVDVSTSLNVRFDLFDGVFH